MIFAAIPIVATFFSYLFAVCVLVGILTRSGITALLITGVFWMSLWSIQTSEAVLNRFVTQQQVDIERFQEGIEQTNTKIAKINKTSTEDDERLVSLEERNKRFVADKLEAEESLESLTQWHDPIAWVLAVSPKNAQTIGLLDRWLSDPDGFDIAAIMNGDMRSFENVEVDEFDRTTRNARERETRKRMQDEYESKSLWYVVGTSLLFEGFILGLAAWYFRRKDF